MTRDCLIPYVPDFVLRFDGALFDRNIAPRLNTTGHALRGKIGTGVSFVTPRPLPYGERGNTVFTTDVSATLGWWLFELGFTCTNLFDSRYRLGEYNYASDFHSAPFPTLVRCATSARARRARLRHAYRAPRRWS